MPNISTQKNEIWLSLDLSSKRGTLALHRYTEGSEVITIEETVVTEDGSASEKFLSVLQEALLQTGTKLSEVARFVTLSGPGSFTGLRIGYASLKGLSYSGNRTIETLSASEARALAWIKQEQTILFDDLYVLTYITMDHFAVGHFKVGTKSKLQFVSETSVSNLNFISADNETVILVDDRINKDSLPTDSNIRVESFRLEARYLGENLLGASSRKTHSSMTDWINLSPNYFGSKW